MGTYFENIGSQPKIFNYNIDNILFCVKKLPKIVMGYTGVKKKDVEIDRGLNFYS